ncbi:uncharacterized protein LOC114574632 [Exaiptasia diaphana]|uniref:EGF-like domain-containing protein n=1 Tax=Exaiptasia diaphana TaxID=2652724 RepID=A0A913YE16_EXADI|nr:uncharacterized protein LOC114574632 [Exaiptasia diaphana]
MRLACIIVVLCSSTAYVTGRSHCVGTCYSGGLFPEPQDIYYGKHLNGIHSYNNITTDSPVKCYSSCVQDCRCKACQMKDKRCELLDEDKTSKNNDFVSKEGYLYFDLRQTIYQGESHMLPLDVSCYNGCCRSQPCMNGGTCTEHCHTPKEKFTCKCSSDYSGKVCEKKLAFSCMDIMSNSSTVPRDGVYMIALPYRKNVEVPVYCSFVSPNQAWILIESFSFQSKSIFERKPFYMSHSVNYNSPPKWNNFRMGLIRMKHFKSISTLFRATCDFPNRASLTPDLLIGALSDVDILNDRISSECKRYKFIDIRGYNCTDCTASTTHGLSHDFHFHLDVTWNHPCDFNPPSKNNVDSFGYYDTVDDNQYGMSTCTATPTSTTQWWFGQEL